MLVYFIVRLDFFSRQICVDFNCSHGPLDVCTYVFFLKEKCAEKDILSRNASYGHFASAKEEQLAQQRELYNLTSNFKQNHIVLKERERENEIPAYLHKNVFRAIIYSYLNY